LAPPTPNCAPVLNCCTVMKLGYRSLSAQSHLCSRFLYSTTESNKVTPDQHASCPESLLSLSFEGLLTFLSASFLGTALDHGSPNQSSQAKCSPARLYSPRAESGFHFFFFLKKSKDYFVTHKNLVKILKKNSKKF
jgi:hypothetical protein